MAVRMLALWHFMLTISFLWGGCCSGSSTFCSASALDGLTALLEGNPDRHDEDGHTMLGRAAAEGRLAALNFLLARGVQPDMLSGGLTPLMWASSNGHTKAMKELLCAGATIDAHNRQGRTALMMASEQRRIEAVEMLLKKQADHNFCRSNWTPLICAASGGCVAVLEMLLQAGAEINAVTQRGKSALLCAVQAGHINLAEALLAAGAKPDHLDIDSGTPLTSAASSGALDAVRLLLGAGAKVNFARADGSSALLLAAQEGHLRAAKALLAAEADPNISSNKGDVPLISALKGRHAGVVKLLLGAGADVDVFDGSGWTPLTCAVHHRMIEPVECLLEKGANPNRAHLSGDTPLGYAINHWREHKQDAKAMLIALAKHGAHLWERKYGNDGSWNVVHAVYEQHARGAFKLAKTFLSIIRARRYGGAESEHPMSPVRWSNWQDKKDLDWFRDLMETGFVSSDQLMRIVIKNRLAGGIYLLLRYGAKLNDYHGQHIIYWQEGLNCKKYRNFIEYSRTPLMCALQTGRWQMAQELINAGASSAYHVTCPARPRRLGRLFCEGRPYKELFESINYQFDAVDDAVALALQEYNDQHWFPGTWWQVPKPGRGFEILRFLAVRNLLTSEQRKRLCSLADCNTEIATLCRIGPRVICDPQGRYSDWTMNDVQKYTTWLFTDISRRLEQWYAERYTPFENVLPRDLVNVVKEFDAVNCACMTE